MILDAGFYRFLCGENPFSRIGPRYLTEVYCTALRCHNFPAVGWFRLLYKQTLPVCCGASRNVSKSTGDVVAFESVTSATFNPKHPSLLFQWDIVDSTLARPCAVRPRSAKPEGIRFRFWPNSGMGRHPDGLNSAGCAVAAADSVTVRPFGCAMPVSQVRPACPPGKASS